MDTFYTPGILIEPGHRYRCNAARRQCIKLTIDKFKRRIALSRAASQARRKSDHQHPELGLQRGGGGVSGAGSEVAQEREDFLMEVLTELHLRLEGGGCQCGGVEHRPREAGDTG